MLKALTRERVGLILVLLSAVGFASKTILAKLAYKYGVDPITLLTLRMIFAGALLAVLTLLRGESPLSLPKLSRREWLIIIVLALCGYYASSLLDFMGLVYINASLGRMILFLYPTLVVVLSTIFFHGPIRLTTWLALALCYGGIFLIILPDLEVAGQNLWLGCGLVFLAAVLYATYLAFIGPVIKKVSPLRFTALVMKIAAGAIFSHFLLIHELRDLRVPNPVLLYSALMGVFATALPIYALAGGIARMGAARAALVSMIGPVVTLFLGAVVLDEHLTLIQFGGVALVLVGVWRVAKK